MSYTTMHSFLFLYSENLDTSLLNWIFWTRPNIDARLSTDGLLSHLHTERYSVVSFKSKMSPDCADPPALLFWLLDFMLSEYMGFQTNTAIICGLYTLCCGIDCTRLISRCLLNQPTDISCLTPVTIDWKKFPEMLVNKHQCTTNIFFISDAVALTSNKTRTSLSNTLIASLAFGNRSLWAGTQRLILCQSIECCSFSKGVLEEHTLLSEAWKLWTSYLNEHTECALSCIWKPLFGYQLHTSSAACFMWSIFVQPCSTVDENVSCTECTGYFVWNFFPSRHRATTFLWGHVFKQILSRRKWGRPGVAEKCLTIHAVAALWTLPGMHTCS